MNRQIWTAVFIVTLLVVGFFTQRDAWAGAGSWPFALGDRPLTLSGGMIEIRGGISAHFFRLWFCR